MKILVLTNSDHFDFINPIVIAANAEHNVHAWNDDEPFPFGNFGGVYDIGISFMYLHKVPAKEVNSHTWINFHPAPLPEYKGRNLCYHAIMNGEKEFGATVHYMDENFDTGDIIEVVKFPIFDWSTAGTLSASATEISRELFRVYFPRIIVGEKFKRHPNKGGTYYKKEPIDDYVFLDDGYDRNVRAITYGDFYPKISIGRVTYKIVRDE